MRFLLDTNIVSEVHKPKPHGGVLAWFKEYQSTGFATPSVVVFELQMGAEKLRLTDPQRAGEFDVWIGRIVGGSDILSLDAAAAREAARTSISVI